MRRFVSRVFRPKSNSFRHHGGGFDATEVPGLWGQYLRAVQHRPVATGIATSAVLWLAGDTVAQLIERAEATESGGSHAGGGDHKKPAAFPDLRRLFGTTAEGSLVAGGLGVYWYAFLDKFVGTTLGLASGSAAFVAAKVGLECVLWHPFTLSLFWTVVGAIEGNSWEKIKEELSTDFTPTLLTEYVLWAPIDILNFKLVPVHLQVLCVNMGCLVEAVLLSYIHSHGFPGSKAAPPAQDVISDKSRVPAVLQSLRPHRLHRLIVIPKTEREARRAFKKMDTDGNGYVSKEQFERHCASGLNVSGAHDRAVNKMAAQLLFRFADSVSPDGRITEEEYMRLVTAFAASHFRSELLSDVVFSLFDKNGDGHLDASELPSFLEVMYGKGLAQEELARIVRSADTNKDGRLSKEEVRSLLAR
jgi:protein Mpv17